MRIPYFWRVLIAAAVFPVFPGCSRTETEELVVGMELAYPPFEMTDASGNPAGVSVDLARALGEHLGREVRIENVSFDGLIPALKTGRIDLVISSMTANEERAKSIDFSDPYVHTGLAILSGATRGIERVEDLNRESRTVSVKIGTTGHVYAQQHLGSARLLVLERESECVLEVVQGTADAFIYDQLSIYKNWIRQQDTTKAILDPFQKESWAVGLRKGNDTLRLQVNEFLAVFRAGGRFDDLADKHLADMKKVFDDLGYPFVF
jgi:polar amino acid transport system substrate-binding protein